MAVNKALIFQGQDHLPRSVSNIIVSFFFKKKYLIGGGGVSVSQTHLVNHFISFFIYDTCILDYNIYIATHQSLDSYDGSL